MDETSGKRFSNPENGFEKADGKRCENIGVVLVHGIGEQRRFEHLSKEVRNLVSAITADAFANASVDVSTTRDSELFAEQQSWLAERVTPVRIHVRYNGGKTRAQSKTLHIHEVWWADLDDRSSLCNRVKFWVWALGMWGSRQFRHSRIPGASGMKVPDGVESCLLEGWVRIQLFAFAVVFALSAVTVNLLNALFRLLRLGQFTNDYFYRWVGDVKLYQDRGCPGKGPLSDLGLPRRVAIRRRMVRELVAAYRGNYDRWYVVAHSLGSVVALNGLMETAHALPNYLNRTACEDLGDDLVKSDSRTNPDDVKRMEPRRPEWITDEHQVLDRKVLFARLRGFVTYGSPLDKYACLWPQIVNVNKDNAVFRDDFEWINVFDQTDPISGNLNAYPDAFGKYNKPKNFAYKTSCVLLFSHMRYLKAKAKRSDSFSKLLVNWMLKPYQLDRSAIQSGYSTSWYEHDGAVFGGLIRLVMWVAVTGFLVVLAGLLWNAVSKLFDFCTKIAECGTGNLLDKISDFSNEGFWFGIRILTIVVFLVALAGRCQWIRDWARDRGHKTRPCSLVGVFSIVVVALLIVSYGYQR